MFTRTRDSLPNGVRLVTLEVPYLHSSLVAVYVRCGSRHESPANSGVSHFLEHMLFRGSENFRDTRRMHALVEEAGGSLNGVTMRDQSFFYTALHPSALPVGFEVLGDVVCRPLLGDVEVEREIILEEMMDEVDAQGRDIDLGNLAQRLVYGDHPLALKIAGTLESVRRLTQEQMREHHRRFYVGRNLVVAAAGQVRPEQTRALAEAAFGSLAAGEETTELPPPAPPQGPNYHFVAHDESQTELLLSFPCPPEGHPDYDALTLLRSVLDDGLSSWLPLYVVENRGLAYSVHASLETYRDAALFEIDAACTPAKVVPLVEEIARLLAKLGEAPVSEQELARVKRRYRLALDFALDDLNALAGWYGGTELYRVPETLEERCDRLERIDAAQLREVASRTFNPANLSVCAVGPGKGRAESKLAKAVAGLMR